ncbi:MAG: glutamate--cysteine ligase [Rivularia sp. (in: Bacteria)]|nr:glutamate--cysteine ligase [Rivularia sp. MS3]
MVLSKGFEIEMYTGTPQGDIIGLSDKITAALDGFMREPDSRNVEYVTAPFYDYERLLCGLLCPRLKLRKYLQKLGNYTLIPGSTLSLGGSEKFFRSDPNNPYHGYIENTYGTKVVTASVHINVGISDPEVLMRACRVIRLEAPLYLALSASSPFLDGKATGYHSTRWGVFPQTPSFVPLFESHAHHIRWTQEQLAQGTMQNVRHLWTSVRPNGDRRPYDLNRLELRICDLVTDPITLLAITALLEVRLLQVINNPKLDPLVKSSFSPAELVGITAQNEANCASNSLDADLTHWVDGRTIKAAEWINELYEPAVGIAKQQGFGCFILPLQKILREGNQAQKWLQLHRLGVSSRNVISQAIDSIRERELELEDKLCSTLLT